MREMKRTTKRILSSIVCLLLLLGTTSAAFAAGTTSNNTANTDVLSQLNKTGKYTLDKVTNPVISSIGGEWSVLGLARSGAEVPQSYYDRYYSNVVSELAEKQGVLTKVKYTEYSRMILALTAIGQDVTDVGGYNLLEKLADFNSVKKQGINGPIFALIALDSKDYSIPKVSGAAVQTTREMLIDYILSKEITDASGRVGGFSLSGETADPDITGMALQALANYRTQPKVKAAIDRALTVLDSLEQQNGGFSTMGVETSESIIQVIIAKSALGIDCADHVSALMKYSVTDGSFQHTLDGGSDMMATEQGLYALAAYHRYQTGKNALYDMSDVNGISGNSDSTGPSGTGEIKATLNGKNIAFDQAPVNINGRVLVPMRAIFEAMGAEITWDPKTKTVTGTKGDKVIILTVGNATARINGQDKALDVPATIINSRTMVPIRLIGESLNADVDWVSATKTVTIVQ